MIYKFLLEKAFSILLIAILFFVCPSSSIAQQPSATSQRHGKAIPTADAVKNNKENTAARLLAPCSGTQTINGCNGLVTINKSCLQTGQYFSYAYYHSQWGNLACFASVDASCNIVTEGWGMCLDYNKSVPNVNSCYTTYHRTTDFTCVGITALQASQILWLMNNAAAWGIDVTNQDGRELLNEIIWEITNPTLWPCGSMCAAAKAAVTTPYQNIECRLTFLCPDNTTVQPMVLYSGLSGGNPLSVGGTVSPNQTICLGQNSLPTTPTLSGQVGTVTRWEYASPSGVWVNWGGAGSTTAPSNCCFNSVGVWKIRAIVQNGICPQSTSTEAQITVVAPPSIATAPTGFSECIGGTQTLSVSASGGIAPYTYQWQNGGTTGASWSNIAGATSATYTPLSNTAGTTLYRVVVSSTGTNCTSTTSSNASVTIVNDPVATVTTAPATVCRGANISLTANTTGGTGTCSVQWQSSPNGVTWVNITGATSNTLSVSTLNSTTRYRIRMTCTGNGCCN